MRYWWSARSMGGVRKECHACRCTRLVKALRRCQKVIEQIGVKANPELLDIVGEIIPLVFGKKSCGTATIESGDEFVREQKSLKSSAIYAIITTK